MALFSVIRYVRPAAAAVLLGLLSLEDIRTRRLPERQLLLLAGASLLRLLPFWFSCAGGGALRAVLADMLAGGAGMLFLLLAVTWLADRIFRRETLGGGDIKLAAALGLHLGFYPALTALLAACAAALAAALLRRRGGSRFPFAPYLAIAGMAAMVLQEIAASPLCGSSK